MKFNIVIIFIFIFSSLQINAQTKSKFIRAAEKAFAEKNYYSALVYYDNVLEFDEKDPVILFKAAESARLFNSYVRAAEKYRFLIDTINDDSQPDALYRLGQMYQYMGKYDEADKFLNLYLAEYGGKDSLVTVAVNSELQNIKFARSISTNVPRTLKMEKLPDDVNTPFSEVGAIEVGDNLYFSSMRMKENNPTSLPAKEVGKIFKKFKDDEATLVEGYLNERDQLISNPSISPDKKQMYYTVCDYINPTEVRCHIYRSDLDSLGGFTNEQKLLDPINIEGFTSTEPYIIIDKITGKEMMFFVSDRPGGAGGLDIWFSLLDPKFGFSEPINLKEINSASDEISPYYNLSDDFLYFSTNGRMGLGGFDIFKVGRTNDAFGAPLMLGVPYNSSYNDIYYKENTKGDKAYFSSNREGSYFVDSYFEACCYDIYKIGIIKIDLDLNALTYDKLTGRILKNATVILLDKDTGQEIARFKNDDANDHKFAIAVDKNYMLVAERENYDNDTLSFSTIGLEKSESITKKMYLSTDMMLLDVFTFTKVGKFPLNGTQVTLIDLSDQEKAPIVVANPLENEFNFMLDRGKQYKIIATKDGFTESEDIIDTRPFDKSGLIRRDLYLDKFVLPDLLPITLYFDNDLPDINSRKTATKTEYGNLVDVYRKRKEEYKEKYSNPLPQNEREEANSELEFFFEGNVNGGYDKLKAFMSSVLQELEAGNKVELILKGFASPRADSKYNLALGQRRVNSVKNEMMSYNNGLLKPYFQSGQITVTDISFGKELAPTDVIGALDDRRNSIYNVRAAKERRVEILRAKRK